LKTGFLVLCVAKKKVVSELPMIEGRREVRCTAMEGGGKEVRTQFIPGRGGEAVFLHQKKKEGRWP